LDTGGDVDAVLGDAAVAAAVRDGGQRGPAGDVVVERDHETMIHQMA